MANNYTQATVDPCIPANLITDDEVFILESAGFTLFNGGDEYYAYIEEGFWEDLEDLELDTQYESVFDIFQAIISRTLESKEDQDIKEFVIEGANTCSKMRCGEFGGFVIRITSDDVQQGGTYCILNKMRQGTW